MIRSYSVTDVGRKRKLNQDYVFASDVRIGAFPNLYIVADGMGGHKAGDFASKFTVDTVVEEIARHSEGDRQELLSRAIAIANTRLRGMSLADEMMTGMGTTVVAATVENGQVLTANIGDSRMYIVSRDEIRQITKDHSLVEEMVRMGGIDREAARLRTDKNIITRAVGVMDEVEVDFFHTGLDTGDKVLLCSDGLTNMLDDTDIHRILCSYRALEEAGNRLIASANDNGGRDNIAVILVETDGGVT